jgi:hypothetical protein
MPILTVWYNASSGSVQLSQLSDDPQDGTSAEQISYLATLAPYSDFQCVSSDYSGPVPATDAAHWRWDGSQITAVIPVPTSVNPRQVRLVLLAQGLLTSVEAMIAEQDEATQITWKYASEFRRDDPLLAQLAANLVPPLSSQQIDEFFIAAAAL